MKGLSSIDRNLASVQTQESKQSTFLVENVFFLTLCVRVCVRTCMRDSVCV